METRRNGREPSTSNLDLRSDAPAEPSLPSIDETLAEVKTDDFVQISVDIPTAAALVVGADSKLQAMRQSIVEELPKFAPEHLDQIKELALKAWHTHLLAMRAQTAGSANPLGEEALEIRKKLVAGLKALVIAGLVPEARVTKLGSGRTHLELAGDVRSAVDIYREYWAVVKNRTAVTKEQVDRAEEFAPELLGSIGIRSSDGPATSDLLKARNRAFTAMVRAYEEIRRVVSYLRWYEGDADQIAPSIYSARGRRSKVIEAEAPVGLVELPAPAAGAETDPTPTPPETRSEAEPPPVTPSESAAPGETGSSTDNE